MKVGLVLEGGGMRGLYTAGVLEHFLVLITFLTSPKEPFATTSVLWETVAI